MLRRGGEPWQPAKAAEGGEKGDAEAGLATAAAAVTGTRAGSEAQAISTRTDGDWDEEVRFALVREKGLEGAKAGRDVVFLDVLA